MKASITPMATAGLNTGCKTDLRLTAMRHRYDTCMIRAAECNLEEEYKAALKAAAEKHKALPEQMPIPEKILADVIKAHIRSTE